DYAFGLLLRRMARSAQSLFRHGDRGAFRKTRRHSESAGRQRREDSSRRDGKLTLRHSWRQPISGLPLLRQKKSSHTCQTQVRHPEVLGANAPSLEGRRPLTISKVTERWPIILRGPRAFFAYENGLSSSARAPQDDG